DPRGTRVFVPNKLNKSELNKRAEPARPSNTSADNTRPFRIAVRDGGAAWKPNSEALKSTKNLADQEGIQTKRPPTEPASIVILANDGSDTARGACARPARVKSASPPISYSSSSVALLISGWCKRFVGNSGERLCFPRPAGAAHRRLLGHPVQKAFADCGE